MKMEINRETNIKEAKESIRELKQSLTDTEPPGTRTIVSMKDADEILSDRIENGKNPCARETISFEGKREDLEKDISYYSSKYNEAMKWVRYYSSRLSNQRNYRIIRPKGTDIDEYQRGHDQNELKKYQSLAGKYADEIGRLRKKLV